MLDALVPLHHINTSSQQHIVCTMAKYLYEKDKVKVGLLRADGTLNWLDVRKTFFQQRGEKVRKVN